MLCMGMEDHRFLFPGTSLPTQHDHRGKVQLDLLLRSAELYYSTEHPYTIPHGREVAVVESRKENRSEEG